MVIAPTMRVPFVDLKAQYSTIKDEVDPAIRHVLENASFVLGEAVTNFEREFARAHDVRYCHGLSSGTAGNHLALWALGIRPGDEVILPVNTFIATAWGATLCGATPIFADCDPLSFTIDPRRVEERITVRTKAIVAVHLYGQAADMDPLLRLAERYHLSLVEDCAQAHLAEYNGRKVGGIGRASSFSFYPGKNLGAYGEGGAVVTNDPDLAAKFKMMRDHGSDRKYYHEIHGHNYRMEGIQGAVLGVKLHHLDRWTDARRKNAALYNELLDGVPDITRPAEMPYAKHVYHLYVIRTAHRDGLQKHLDAQGISTGLHYPIPLHLQRVFAGLGWKEGDFPEAEKAAREMLSLPMYAELEEKQIRYVCDAIRGFFD